MSSKKCFAIPIPAACQNHRVVNKYFPMISQQEVQHIAKLARLTLSNKDVEKMQGELAAILDYIALLREVDVAGIEPTSHSLTLANIAREDEVFSQKEETSEGILKQFPDKDGNFLKVNPVRKGRDLNPTTLS